MLRELFKSKLYIFCALAVLLGTGIFLGKELYTRYQIDLEIRGLDRQVTELQQKNHEVSQMIQYFKTTEYKERQARSLLNLQKPGEFAVALPVQEDQNAGTADDTETKKETNLKKWWNYFFDHSSL